VYKEEERQKGKAAQKTKPAYFDVVLSSSTGGKKVT
jgi:hypothetical protein